MLVRFVQAFIAVSVALMLFQVAPKVDGLLWPVYTNVELQSTEVVENTEGFIPKTLVFFTFTFARQCTWEETHWYRGRPGTAIDVPTAWAKDPKPLLVGDHGESWRYIYMSPEDIRNNSYAESIHDCYDGWLWKTKTRWWSPTER